MTADNFRAALACLGLTQTGAARVIGVDARTVRRWAETGAPRVVALLLDAWERHPREMPRFGACASWPRRFGASKTPR